MSSLGYVMMNWSALLLSDDKKQRRKELLGKRDALRDRVDLEDAIRKQVEHTNKHKEPEPCLSCSDHVNRVASLEDSLALVNHSHDEVRVKLESLKATLSTSIERESRLRGEYDALVLQEAQARYDLDELRSQLKDELEKRDVDHERQMHDMEQLMSAKNMEWSHRYENAQLELRNAMHRSIEQSNVENMSRQQLEQELSSLQHVLSLRSEELQKLRQSNAELSRKLERHYWLESELNKARQRLEEMSLVVQNKMIAEKELIDMTEALTNDLSASRIEVQALRRELENKNYLKNRIVEGSDSPTMNKENQHRNQHQKASSGGEDPTLVVDLREKSEAVAWMLHIPDSPKITHSRRPTYA